MKRDMELVKRLLLYIEDVCDNSGIYSIDSAEDIIAMGLHDAMEDAEATDFEQLIVAINYHLQLMADAGLIKVTDSSSGIGQPVLFHRLTWDGAEFLEASRNNSVWNQVLSKLGGEFSGVPFSVIKMLLIETIKRKLDV